MIPMLAAAALACAVGVLTIPPRPAPLDRQLGLHFEAEPPPVAGIAKPPSAMVVAAAAGGAAGAVLPAAAGFGFRPSAIVFGAGLAVWIASARTRADRDRGARRQTAEVPTVADVLALHVLAGDSIAAALAEATGRMTGIVVDDLEAALDDPEGLEHALAVVAAAAPSPHAARLYETLAHAHRSGGRLADTLSGLAIDVRAAIGRDVTVEGGKRALAAYGPILALMVPTTLLFLMYPTVVGLTSLSGS